MTIFTFQHKDSSGTNIEPTVGAARTIQYDDSNNQWSDLGSGQPVEFTVNDSNGANKSSTVVATANATLRGFKGGTNNALTMQIVMPANLSDLANTGTQLSEVLTSNGTGTYWENVYECNIVSLQHTSGALYSNYEWRYHSDTTTHHLYGMYHTTNGAFNDIPGSLIKVGKSGQSDHDTWSDHGSLHPISIADNGTTVSFDYSGTTYSFNKPLATDSPVPTWLSSGSGSGGGINPQSTNPKIENLTFTKTSDSTLNVSFDWENLSSFTFSRADAGVNNVTASTGTLSGSSGTVNTSFHVSCQEGDLCWVHGNYNNNSLTHNPNIHGGMLDPYIFRLVEFSVSGTTLTVKTFLSGSTGLNNDADLRVNDPKNSVWQRVDYLNYDGTLQTYNVTPFQRGFEYYVVDRSTGNDYGSRFLAPGKMRGTRGRTFW